MAYGGRPLDNDELFKASVLSTSEPLGEQDYNEKAKPIPEWTPLMLRRLPIVLMTLYCVGLITGLTILNMEISRRKGLPMEQEAILQAIRYIPTVLFIILGLLWRRLVSDLKKITPWVAISKHWTSAEDSVLVNYFGSLEVLSIWPAIRKRHWPLFLGLVTGLACGALVPLAAVLTHESVSTLTTSEVPLRAYPFTFINASLHLPSNFTGGKAYAQASNILRGNSEQPPWTTQDYAFEAFEVDTPGQYDIDANTTLRANTGAIGSLLHCDAIRSEVRTIFDANDTSVDFPFGTSVGLFANEEDLRRAKCDVDIVQQLQWCDGPGSLPTFNETNVNALPFGWLNFTDCSGDWTDARLMYTLLQPFGKQSAPTWWSGKDMFRSITLLCSPSFRLKNATMEVHANSHEIKTIRLSDESVEAALRLSVIDYVGYLNNPFNPRQDEGDSYTVQGTTIQVNPQIQTCGSDWFTMNFQALALHPVAEYFDNSSLLIDDFTAVAATTMTQLISNFGRGSIHVATTGELHWAHSRVFLRQWSLRILQALLAGLTVAIVCLATIIRPRTNLSEDPGLLATFARILARSSNTEASIKRNSMRLADFQTSTWRLTRTPEGFSRIDSKISTTLKRDKAQSHVKSYRAVGTRDTALVLLTLFFVALIATLATLTPRGTTKGFTASSEIESIAWSSLPTTLLVLAGYAISGAISGIQRSALYLLLRENEKSGRRTMLFNPGDRSTILLPVYALTKIGSLSLFLGAFASLIYPGVKIAAAGLYTTRNGTAAQDCQVSIDQSILHGVSDMLNFVYDADDNERTYLGQTTLASDEVEWLMMPDLGLTPSPGTLENLVFANLTSVSVADGQENTVGGSLTLRIPAVAFDAKCYAFDNSHFQIAVKRTPGPNDPDVGYGFNVSNFVYGCTDELCRELLYEDVILEHMNPKNGTAAYWTYANWNASGFQVFIQNQTDFSNGICYESVKPRAESAKD